MNYILANLSILTSIIVMLVIYEVVVVYVVRADCSGYF